MSEAVLKSRKGTRLFLSIVEESQRPVVVFVHNMFGSCRSSHRHVKLFNEAGYTTITFDLVHASTNRDAVQPTLSASSMTFMYLKWVEQITDVLDSLPGRKIVFSFSGPSVSALISASGRKDIDKYICDGGPFREFWECTYRMFTIEKKIMNPIKRWLWTTGSCLLWGPLAFGCLTKALRTWDTTIPLLSIRGAQDPIVYPQNIQNVFEKQKHIDIQVYLIEKGQHLDGLKNFPEEYSQIILNFLNEKSNIQNT